MTTYSSGKVPAYLYIYLPPMDAGGSSEAQLHLTPTDSVKTRRTSGQQTQNTTDS